MSDRTEKVIKYIVLLALAVLCIWMVAKKIDWVSFWLGLERTEWVYVILFAIACVLAILFRTWRWRDLMRPLNASVSTLKTWDSTNIGNVVNIALPGAGEFIRCGLLSTKKAGYDKTLGTILMERICDFLAIVLLLVTALLLKWSDFSPFFGNNVVAPMEEKAALWKIAVPSVVFIALAIILIFRFRGTNSFCAKVAGVFTGMAQGLGSFLKMDRKWLFLSYTAGVWAMYVLMSWLGLKAIPELENLTIVDALFISAIGNLASVIPVPSGMGPYHYLVMTTLAALYACPDETGLLYAVLCHETHAIVIILLGVMSYARLSLSKKKSG